MILTQTHRHDVSVEDKASGPLEAEQRGAVRERRDARVARAEVDDNRELSRPGHRRELEHHERRREVQAHGLAGKRRGLVRVGLVGGNTDGIMVRSGHWL